MVSALLEPPKKTLERGDEPLVEPTRKIPRSSLNNIVNFSPKVSAVVQLARLGNALQGLKGAVNTWFGSKSNEALIEVKKRDQTFLSLSREVIDRQLSQNTSEKNGDTATPEISHALAERRQLHNQVVKEMVEPLIRKEADTVNKN